MICPFYIFTLLGALLTAIVALYFLQFIRREGLDWLFKTIAYVTLGFSILVFLGGIVLFFLSQSCSHCNMHKCSKSTDVYMFEHSCCDHKKEWKLRVHPRQHKGDTLKMN